MISSEQRSEQSFWLNIDKPLGDSSAKVVAIVKKLTGAKKVGHAGTLDPLATGVLPIAVGRGATKNCWQVVGANKKYYCKIIWGEFRNTDDSEGKVVGSSAARPKTNDIISILPNFIGKIKQIPPQFSAIKIAGKKAYDIARSGQFIDLQPREVEIHNIKLISNNSDYGEFEISCGKGTYIRSFARELAQKLDVCGYIGALIRLQVGGFLLSKTISLAKLKNMINYCGLCRKFFEEGQINNS